MNNTVIVAKNEDEAITMLRMHEGVFELVLIDAYLAMSINIIEFKRYVEEDLKIPLVCKYIFHKLRFRLRK